MTSPLRILGLGGSVRADSHNKRLLELTLEMAREHGADIRLADVHSMQLPIFDPELPAHEQPQQLHTLIASMQWADGFVLCSPTYLGSLSGAVKNMLDSLHLAHGEPRVYFEGRPVMLASYGYYGQRHTISSLDFVARVMGADVLPESLAITGDEAIDGEQTLSSALVQAQMRSAVTYLMQATEVSLRR